MAPYPLADYIGHVGLYLVYLLIGMGFGAALEMSGFAMSSKLTGQFYLHDQTVFKVMFTGVIVAMVLTFGASALGMLDFDRVWVPPTYLWPGIVGGLMIGIGFLVGGFCPGTSIVGASTGKIDAVFYLGGILTGIVIFGETEGMFTAFRNSSYYGRLTIPDWLGVNTGTVVFVIAVVAVVLLLGAEQLERIFRKEGETPPKPPSRWRLAGAGALIAVAAGVMLIGQPTVEQLWQQVSTEKDPLLVERQVQIHPAELRSLYYDSNVNLVMFDVRDESDFNLFHLRDAMREDVATLVESVPELMTYPDNTVFVLMSNDEARATDAWKQLVAQDVRNIYILEGGINNWLAVYGEGEYVPIAATTSDAEDDMLRFQFTAALGDMTPVAVPSLHNDEVEFTPKVELEKKAPTGGGGCG